MKYPTSLKITNYINTKKTKLHQKPSSRHQNPNEMQYIHTYIHTRTHAHTHARAQTISNIKAVTVSVSAATFG